MSVEVNDRAGADMSEAEVARVVEAVLAAERVGDIEVGVVFIDADAMQELNRQHRAQDAPTDVLSFPIDSDDDQVFAGVPRMLGDVVICVPVLIDQAAEQEVTPGEELTDLLVHGVLHLLGYDHEADDGEMLARQDEIVGELVSIVWQPATE